MRRSLALAALTSLTVAAPALAAGTERVSVKPRVGDVNTRFVYRGSGWKPNARLIYTHGALCGTGPCILPLFFKHFESDADGRFRQSERPTTFVQDDFVGYTVCFGYAKDGEGPSNEGGCKATAKVSVAPPSADVTPATARRSHGDGTTMTVAGRHFKAGSKLKIHIRYPGGRHRVLHTRARRHGGYVGPANAFAPRGGFVKLFEIEPQDPDGTYRWRVVDPKGHEAVGIFVVQHYHD
jgi:hypothetical protein